MIGTIFSVTLFLSSPQANQTPVNYDYYELRMHQCFVDLDIDRYSDDVQSDLINSCTDSVITEMNVNNLL